MKSVKLSDLIKPAAIRQLPGILLAIVCLLGLPASASAAAKAQAAPARSASGSPFSSGSSHSSGGHGLAHEWEPVNELKPYKQNYFLLYAHSSQPNNLPTSTNPLNSVLVPYALDNRMVKFQISFKHALADYQRYGSLWFGYTQLGLWQYYDQVNSRPFQETDYEPELIYSLRPNDASILNFGVVHQSNGESNPRSRSWDRVYIKPGLEFSTARGRVIVQVRWWQRIAEDPATDNNPDIVNYLGYRDIELRYEMDGSWKVSVIARNLATQVDIAAPLSSWLMLGSESSGEHLADLHLQYFNGYGEGLLDYNQSHVTLGLGVSFPF